ARKPTPRGQPLSSKSLPKSPAEVVSGDLVVVLQAQLDDLEHRRHNLQKVIQSMTEGMPQNSNAYDLRSREEVKKKLEGFKLELADVQKKEYDIGLRLHRAWKRRDSNAVFESSGLWVRRITG